MRKDRGVQKEIQSLEVDCPTRPDPCTWRGPLVEIEVRKYQWNLSIRTPLNKGHLYTQDTLICPKCNINFVYLTIPEMRALHYSGHLICPNGVQIREIPLYTI